MILSSLALRRFALLCALTLVASALPAPGARAVAQSTYGTLVGVVLGPDGNPLDGAAVTVINSNTGNPRTVVTDSSGNYQIPFLSPGLYSVRVTAQGLSEYQTKDFVEILISVKRTISPPIQMSAVVAAAAQPADPAAPPAGPAAQATMQSATTVIPETLRSPLIDLYDATRRGNFNDRTIQALPLPNVRSFDDFAHLISGVSPAPETLSSVPGPGIGAGIGTAGQFSVNGQRPRSNNFTVDGSDNNDPDVGVRRQGFVSLVPQSIESVQEFQISTFLWSAESGRNLGSQVNVVSRSGGDVLHGQVYGFFNDSALNARNPFDLDSREIPATVPVFSTLTGRQALLDGSPLSVPTNVGGENPYTRVQTGFVVGGPILKGRTHFFGSLEYQKINAALESNFAVPTLDERGVAHSGGSGLFVLPFSFDADNGISETRSVRPATKVGSAIFSLFPFPNNPFGPYGEHNYTEILPAGGRGVVGSAKVDHSFRLFGRESALGARFNFTDDNRLIPSVGGALFSTLRGETRTQNLSVIMTTAISPRLANLFRASYGRTQLSFGESRNAFLRPSALGFPFLLNAPLLINATHPLPNAAGGFPRVAPTFLTGDMTEDVLDPLGQIIIAGYSPVGVDVFTFPQERTSTTLQFADTASYSYRDHNFKFGVDVRPIRLDSDQDRNSRPLAVFNPSFYFGNPVRNASGNNGERTDTDVILSGADLAALGAPTDYFQTLATEDAGDREVRLRFTEWNGFLHDDWRLRPGLTLSLGVRYEYNSVPHDVDGRIESSFSNDAVSLLPSLAQILDGRERIYDPDRNNIGPRIGFAWSPQASGKTVVRGGYGVYYDAILGAVVSQSRNVVPNFLSFNAGFRSGRFKSADVSALRPRAFDDLVQDGSLNQLTADLQLADVLTFFGQNNQFADAQASLSFVLPQRDLETPYAQQFGLTVERELWTDYAVSAAYVGVLSRHLLRANAPNGGSNTTPFLVGISVPSDSAPVNDVPVAIGSAAPVDRIFADLGGFTLFESSGKSAYHGLQLEMQKRYSRNFSFQASYTWSHVIDDASDVFDLAGGSAFPQNPARPSDERSDASFDVRHRATGSMVWSLPWFADQRGLTGLFLSGWRVADRVSLQTGHPYTINTFLDIDQNGLPTDRPGGQYVETGDSSAPVSTTVAPFDYVGFSDSGYYDSSRGRNSFRTPRAINVDLALSKELSLTEAMRLEFRTEVFNLLNRPNYGIPVRFLEAPGFGRAVSTTTAARQIQFALRLNF